MEAMEVAYQTPTGVSSAPGEHTWEIAGLFPLQGHWTESDFLSLPAPHRFELSKGRLETLPMPNWVHALIVQYLSNAVDAFAKPRKLGRAVPAPLYVRLWEGEIRQPDVVFCFYERIVDRLKTQNGADLAIEVVSEGKENRERDTVEKRKLYAQAGIREYWIVDPLEDRTISVLALEGDTYRTSGVYKDGESTASLLLPGFSVDVQAVFAAAEE
jgi:Uma2 family endonuclease